MLVKLCIAMVAFAMLSIIAGSFVVSLPKWCNEPEIGVNWLVVPMCKG